MIGASILVALALGAAAEPPPAPAPHEPLYDGAAGSSVEAAYQAAQSHQGPLDGRWRLSDGFGGPLYDFIFADPAGDSAGPTHGGAASIQGAWRNLRRSGALADAGVLDDVLSRGTQLTIRFVEPGRDRAQVVHLSRSPSGGWIGELEAPAGTILVFMDRL